VAASGALVAVLAGILGSLEFRYALTIYVGLAALGVLAVLLRRIEAVLVYALILHIPFSTFGKWLYLIEVKEEHFYFAQGVNIGGAELLLLFAYSIWFWRIFVARTEPVPRFTRVDVLVLVFFFAATTSLTNAANPLEGIFDLIFSAKCALIYFYLSRKVTREQLPGIIIMFLLAMTLQAMLAGYEHLTGIVGIGRTKGNASMPDFGEQYEVPGFGHVRAEGTTLDSHALGLFFSMTLPIPFVLMGMQFVRLRWRMALASVVVMGGLGLLVTFCRSAYISCAVSLTMTMAIMMVFWKQGKLVFLSLLTLSLAVLAYPDLYRYARERFFEAPSEVVTVRYDTYWTALEIWKHNFLFGYGAGNYYDALEDPRIKVFGDVMIVHNAFLLVASETGLFGVIGYFGMILSAMALCLRQLKCQDLLIRSLALAILAALVASQMQGLSDCLFKDPVDYALLWTHVGLACALNRMATARAAPTGS
jgi:hypothetical protein